MSKVTFDNPFGADHAAIAFIYDYQSEEIDE